MSTGLAPQPAVPQRTALSLRRGESAHKRARDRAIADRLSVDLDPELLYLKQRYRVEFEAAFSRAVEGLTDRERAILRLHLVAGLTLDAIGVMYHVNTSTVSRWLGSWFPSAPFMSIAIARAWFRKGW